jgi:phosphohistidine swiveling domain-containing protein
VVNDLGSLPRGGSAPLAAALTALTPPDPALADRCMALAGRLMAQRMVGSSGQFWALPADLGPILGGALAAPDAYRRSYRAALKWEPLLYSTVIAAGRPLRGTPASPGMGCGHVVVVDEQAALTAAERGGLRPRSVIAAARPLPRFAPLLMNAAGLISQGGSEAAHLVEVARSLGVPAVLGCDLSVLVPPSGGYAALDGAAGVVSVLSNEGE